jgi:hypothetical protein
VISAKLTLHTEAAKAAFLKAAWDAVRYAAHFFWDKLHQELNGSWPPASAPGQPPHTRTGFLKKNVLELYDQPNLQARVGLAANVLYGIFLELGTKRMKARPWLFATLNKYRPQLEALLGGISMKVSA